jgi:hypothetical protein
MTSENTQLARAVKIGRGYWDVPVRVGLRPYVRFTLWMDGQLQKLVARWAHTAAPNALGFRQRRFSSGR